MAPLGGRLREGVSPVMEMYATSTSKVVALLSSLGVRVVDVSELLGNDDWLSVRYIAIRS